MPRRPAKTSAPRCRQIRVGPAALLALAMAACAPLAGNQTTGFEQFLPPPLDAEWRRSTPVTVPADSATFGGGISTRAEYRKDGETCVITITGDAPMMQGFSMNFSNPAAAGLTGARVAYVGDEPIVVTRDGEVQTLTRNYLTQFAGNCSYEAKVAYVARMDRSLLREYRLPHAGVGTAAANGTAATVDWNFAYGGPDKDWAYAMTGTRDGGLCTAGRTASQGAGLEDVWVVRLDGKGRRLWDRALGGAAIDRGRAVVETRDLGLVVAGATESGSAGEFDVWVAKLDATGQLLWERRFGGTATDWASGVVETRDGGLALAAYTQDAPGAPYDFWVIRLDADGGLLWERRYGGAATDWTNGIAETADGNLVVVGHTESKGAGNADYWVLKLDPRGEVVWDHTFGGPGVDYATAVTATADGGAVVTGQTQAVGAPAFDSRVLKLDAAGNVVWDRVFGGAQDDWLRWAVETRDGGLAFAGYTTSQGAGLYDVWMLKLDHDGGLLWDRTFGGPENDWARAVVEMPDGGLAFAGDTRSSGAGELDVLVLRVGSASQ